MAAPITSSNQQMAHGRALHQLSNFTFSLYLALLLGTTSVARGGGPISWLPLWRLPAADGGWEVVGFIAMLPVISVCAWLSSRLAAGSLGKLSWGWPRVVRPLVALSVLGLLSTLLPCLNGACTPSSFVRLILLLANLAWVALYIINERPSLFWVVVVAITVQSTVAIAQFVSQGDLGLWFLGESRLDPQSNSVTVVMRGTIRWLRAYGLTMHPNVLAGTLVTLLLMLPVVTRQPSMRQRLGKLFFLLGFAALLTTLSRWAGICLALGLGIQAIPHLRGLWAGRRSFRPAPAAFWFPAALLAIGALFMVVYGDAVVGRAVALDTPVESRSLWERGRDTDISLRLLAEHPLSGVGLGQYVAAARRYDAWAETVHNVPLLLGAELGILGVAAWLWLVGAPLWRRNAFTRHASETGLWLGFWLMGLLHPAPHPLYELRSALLAGMVAGLIALSVDE